MAGIIGIYGLVVSVLISNDLKQKTPLFTGFIQLGAGLSVGLAGLAAGFAIGIVGDAGVRGTAQQPRLFVGMILILIFAEVLGTCQPVALSAIEINTYISRSLRSHCRPVDELPDRPGRFLLDAPLIPRKPQPRETIHCAGCEVQDDQNIVGSEGSGQCINRIMAHDLCVGWVGATNREVVTAVEYFNFMVDIGLWHLFFYTQAAYCNLWSHWIF